LEALCVGPSKWLGTPKSTVTQKCGLSLVPMAHACNPWQTEIGKMTV
jgi:hypothetical protein